MFEVPQRQQLASERTPLSLFAPAHSPACVPGTCAVNALLFSVVLRNSVPERGFSCTEWTRGTVEGLLWYATHLRHSVQKTGFYGTEEKFGAKNRRFWYGTDHSVQKKASWGTRCVFRGPRCMKTPSCRTGRIFSARNGLLLHRTPFRKR